jgi:putative transposase
LERGAWRDLPERRPIRLQGRDYSQAGQYFVTVVTAGREELFGAVTGGEMLLSAAGTVVAEVWAGLPSHYPRVSLDAFIIMPNHVHGIVQLGRQMMADGKHVPLSEIVRAFKTYSARRVNLLRGVSGAPVWQRNYYERVIRDDQELGHVRQYIAENPSHWNDDSENPVNRPQRMPARHGSRGSGVEGRCRLQPTL